MSQKESQIKMFQHSEVKVRLLKLYLEKYLSILTHVEYLRDIYIYDVFCGEGIYEDGGTGSPIIILKTINEVHDKSVAKGKRTGHFQCHFNDFDQFKVNKLKLTVEDRKLASKDIGNVLFTVEDYQSLLPVILTKVNKLSAKERAFVFIDPYGYKDVSVGHITSLLDNKKTEVLLFLPTQFMFRFESKGTPESLKQFINELVPKEYWPKSETGIEFIERLRDGFRRIVGDRVFVDSFIITRDKNQFFSLFFFTNHIYGFDRMLESKWEIDAEEGRGWSYDEPTLFNDRPKVANTVKFERALKDFIKSFKTNGEIYEFTIRSGHLVSHTTDILARIQNDGHLEVLGKDGKPQRRGSFFVRYQDYKNSPDRIKLRIT